MNDTKISELLDELTPSYSDRPGDWERVAAAARPRRRGRVAAGAVLALAAAVALTLAWPFHSENGGLVQRALAAVGDGPVLHVVLRGEWGGTLVNLDTGARSPVYGDDEFWYDTRRGRVHSIERLGDVVQDEELYDAKQPPADLVALGREYRQALEAGTARVAEEGTVDGEPAAWITIRSESLPDVADGKDHAWTQQVAVSRRTYEPVALRETRDGEPIPGTEQRVVDLQFVSEDTADFTAARPSLEGTAFKQGRAPIALEQAGRQLGRAPLWLGREYGGLPLAQVYRQTTAIGRRLASKGQPIEWSAGGTSVVFFYGTLGDDPGRPYLTVTESTRATSLPPGAGSYLPPTGSVFLRASGQAGALQLDGLHVTIDAENEAAILAAARELRALPS